LVQFDAHNELNGGKTEVLIGAEKRHSVSDEIHGAFVKAVTAEQLSAAHSLKVLALGGLGVSGLELVHVDDEILLGKEW
jgi:hypothetical protein